MIRIIVLMAMLVLIATVCAVAAGARPTAGKAKKHILVVTWTTGFRHKDTIGEDAMHDGPAQKILAEIGEKSGVYDVDYCRSQEDVTRMLTPEGLKKFDGVIFANTTGNLHIPSLKAFADWIAAGHGFVGMHSAGDTYHPRDADGDKSYIEMIGGEFRGHNRQCEVEALVNDSKHPAVKHLAPSAKFFDEIYLYQNNDRLKVHVLLSMDKHPNDGAPDANQPGDYLLSWCKQYGKGRVFYTGLGHRPDVWAREDYQKHILGGIKWALSLEKGDAMPGNPAPNAPR